MSSSTYAVVGSFFGVLNVGDVVAQEEAQINSYLCWSDRLCGIHSLDAWRQTASDCIDVFPPPLLLRNPLDKEVVPLNAGCPLSANIIIISSATLSH